MADFTAVGDKTIALSFNDGETISWSLSGTFTGSVVLEKTRDPVAGAYVVVQTLSSATSESLKHEGRTAWYRLRCTVIGESETITVAIAEAAGQVSQTFRDASGNVRLEITDQGATVTGTLTASLSGAFSGTHTGAAALGAVVHTPTVITAEGAIPNTTSFVQLNKAGGALAVTTTPTAGQFLVITQIDAGTAGHTVTLAPGTYDGTNSIATFNAAGETLVLFGLSSTRFAVVENVGSVALSAP